MPTKTPSTVLVVDDEELIRWTLSELLSAQGLRVVEAGNGAEARAAFNADITVAFFDLRLPDADGITLARELMAVAPRCAIYLMTAYLNDDVAEDAKRAGILRVLDKPFALEEIEKLAGDAARDTTP